MNTIKNYIKKFIQDNREKCFGIAIGMMIIVLAVGGVLRYNENCITEMSYNEFLTMVEQGQIESINYGINKEYMKFNLKSGEKYKTLFPNYEDFRVDMLKAGIYLSNKDGIKTEQLIMIIIDFTTIILSIFILLIIRSTNKKIKPKDILEKSDIRFENVIGLDEIIDDVSFYVSLIKNPKAGKEIGSSIPKGILLTGSPGTGKTLIAKAIAGEADVPFISISGSEFQELYKGVGAKRVREVFKIARENAPCIIFIDEIDAIGLDRGSNKSDSEDAQTINQLLKEMDGFSGLENVFILAATNFPEKLDKALTRSGRFDRQVVVKPPRTWKIRKQLFEYYLKNYKVEDNLNIDNIAKVTSGFTGADIKMICNEAGLVALSQNKSKIDDSSIEEALDKKIFAGNRAKIERKERDKEIVAYHEAGHAVMKYLCNDPISRVSIIETTSGVGGAVFGEDNDSTFMTQEEIRNHIAICYAGRISEIIKFGNATTGAQNDISQATELLELYVGKYGFDEEIGLIDIEKLGKYDLINKEYVHERICKIEKEIYNSTLKYLTEQYQLVERLALELMENETMTGKEVLEVLKRVE